MSAKLQFINMTSRPPPSVYSTSGLSFASSKLSTSSKKRNLQPQSVNDIFSQRFQSVLFSLYNPPDRERAVYGNLPPLSEDISGSQSNVNDIPEFNSPLCSYTIKTEIKKDKETRNQQLDAFHNRSVQLINELSQPDYDKVQISIVPYETDKEFKDINSNARKKKADDRIRQKREDRSIASYRRQDEERMQKETERRTRDNRRNVQFQQTLNDMENDPNDYRSPSLAKKKIQREKREQNSTKS